MRAEVAASSRVRAGQAVFGQDPGERPEAVGFHHVAADVEERPVQVGDHVRPGGHEHLVAALEGRAAKVVGSEVAQLQVGADGSVENHHSLAHGLQVRTHSISEFADRSH